MNALMTAYSLGFVPWTTTHGDQGWAVSSNIGLSPVPHILTISEANIIPVIVPIMKGLPTRFMNLVWQLLGQPRWLYHSPPLNSTPT